MTNVFYFIQLSCPKCTARLGSFNWAGRLLILANKILNFIYLFGQQTTDYYTTVEIIYAVYNYAYMNLHLCSIKFCIHNYAFMLYRIMHTYAFMLNRIQHMYLCFIRLALHLRCIELCISIYAVKNYAYKCLCLLSLFLLLSETYLTKKA